MATAHLGRMFFFVAESGFDRILVIVSDKLQYNFIKLSALVLVDICGRLISFHFGRQEDYETYLLELVVMNF